MNNEERSKKLAELYAELDIVDIKIKIMRADIEGRLSRGSAYDVQKRELISLYELRQTVKQDIRENMKNGGPLDIL